MSIIKKNKNELLFLLPIFICFVSIPSLSIDFNTYLQFIAYPLILLAARKTETLPLALVILFVFILNYFKHQCDDKLELIIMSIKIILYIGVIIVLANRSSFEKIIQVFVFLAKISSVIIIATYLIGIISGINILVNLGYSQTRYHALFTEPSAAAIPLSILALYGVLSKNYKWLVISFVATLISLSLIALVLFVTSLIMGLMIFYTEKRVSLFVVSLVSIISIFYISLDTIEPLYKFNERLYSGLRAILTGGEHGYNPRLMTINSVINQLIETDSLYTGLGIEINNCLNEGFIWSYDANIHIYIIRSLGFVGYFIFLIACFLAIIKNSMNKYNMRYSVFIICLLGVTLNGAQGLLYFSLFVLLLLLSFKRGED